MIKEDIISEILQKFGQLGIPCQTGNGTDITISTEFLDAKWGSGKKKISYKASIYAEESSNTFFMWEMTKETGSGFSFGSSSESSFQSGTTLFRKVKGVQYGLDGKAYEYTLDLGAIPKAVKETAKNSGWKFKTVLKKEKALWPGGVSPPPADSQVKALRPAESRRPATPEELSFCTKCGNSLSPEASFCAQCGSAKQNLVRPQEISQNSHQQQVSTPPADRPPQQKTEKQQNGPGQENVYPEQRQYDQEQDYSNFNRPRGKKPGALFWGLFSLLSLFDLIMFIGGSGLLFAVLSAFVLVGLFLIRNSLSNSVIKPIGAFVGATMLTFIVFALTGVGGDNKSKTAVNSNGDKSVAGFSFSIGNKDKPDIVKEGFARTVEEKTAKPLEKVTSFSQKDEVMFYSLLMKYLPKDTDITTKWYFNGKLQIETEPTKMQKNVENQYYTTHLQKGENPFPLGNYKVEVIMTKEGKEIYKCSDEFDLK